MKSPFCWSFIMRNEYVLCLPATGLDNELRNMRPRRQAHDEQAGLSDIFGLQSGIPNLSAHRRRPAIEQGRIGHAGQDRRRTDAVGPFLLHDGVVQGEDSRLRCLVGGARAVRLSRDGAVRGSRAVVPRVREAVAGRRAVCGVRAHAGRAAHARARRVAHRRAHTGGRA